MRTKKGSQLEQGDEIDVLGHRRTIKSIRKTTIPAKVLNKYYADQYPDGMPGAHIYFPHERDRVSSMTVFDNEEYEVV